MADFIGSGWSFPVRCDVTSSIATNSGHERIQQSIRIILGTAFGERQHRPEFGCGIHDLVFESPGARLVFRLEQEIRASLIRWEPRIDVRAVTAAADERAEGRVLIDIAYAIRSTGDVRNLVFPFYTLGADAA